MYAKVVEYEHRIVATCDRASQSHCWFTVVGIIRSHFWLHDCRNCWSTTAGGLSWTHSKWHDEAALDEHRAVTDDYGGELHDRWKTGRRHYVRYAGDVRVKRISITRIVATSYSLDYIHVPEHAVFRTSVTLCPSLRNIEFWGLGVENLEKNLKIMYRKSISANIAKKNLVAIS